MVDEIIPLTGAEIYSKHTENLEQRYIVASMFTPHYENYARRLKESLEKLGINHALYRVPAVHKSISAKGGDDLAFCKANFILQVLKDFQRPVLYTDADMVFCEAPAKIDQYAQDQTDFAIYNWLADVANEGYVPVKFQLGETITYYRFYKFCHSIDFFDPAQLRCSGAVQYYANSDAAKKLLYRWKDAVRLYPNVEDDHLLDYAFNMLSPSNSLKAAWLEKEYCRYAWWIHTRPIIDHPQFVNDSDPSRGFEQVSGLTRLLAPLDNNRARRPYPHFPRQDLVDTEQKILVGICNDGPVILGKLRFPICVANVYDVPT